MRKTVLLLVLIALPLVAFAELQLGVTALYNVVFAPDETRTIGLYARTNGISLDDFTFGADARLKFGIFQGSMLGLISPGSEYMPTEIEIYLDAGLAFDLLFLRLGIGLGPNVILAIGGGEGVSKPLFFGGNIKLTADVMIGGIAVGLNYLMYLQDFSKESFQYLANNIEGNIGLSILFKL